MVASSALIRARRRLLRSLFRLRRAWDGRWAETECPPKSRRFTFVVDLCIAILLSDARGAHSGRHSSREVNRCQGCLRYVAVRAVQHRRFFVVSSITCSVNDTFESRQRTFRLGRNVRKGKKICLRNYAFRWKLSSCEFLRYRSKPYAAGRFSRPTDGGE